MSDDTKSDQKKTVPDLRKRYLNMGRAEEGTDNVRCDACPVLCRIRPGNSGACSRYENRGGQLHRADPFLLTKRQVDEGGRLISFLASGPDWDGTVSPKDEVFVTGIGSGTTYPDYKPAPLIVASQYNGFDAVTVVTEGIFSFCGAKIKIDTDRHIGSETATVYANAEPVGHVTTGEYGSQMLSVGGVRHLTGGTKKEGRTTCQTLLALCNGEDVELQVEGGSSLLVGAGRPPTIDGRTEQLMRIGCGSAAVGMFASSWCDLVDEAVVIDAHITGVLTEHQAGKVLHMKPSGIQMEGQRSTPGRYFKVANPGSLWGGTDIDTPLSAIRRFDPKVAYEGLRLLITSTTGEESAYYELDSSLEPVEKKMPSALAETVRRIRDNCEPARTSISFMAGAGGSLRAGATKEPLLLTRSAHDSVTKITMGGAPTYLWPGGGITIMVDVEAMPESSFGSVPTPAIVAPIEFTLARDAYEALGGHMDYIVPIETVRDQLGDSMRVLPWRESNPWPLAPGRGVPGGEDQGK